MLVDYCEKNLSLLMHGDGEEHSGDDSSEIRSVDDSYNEHGFSSDDYSGVRSVEYDDSGNEQSGVNNTDVTSVHDGDNWNEQSSDGDAHVKSLDDNVNDIKSKLFLESLREVENTCAQEIVQETGIPDLFQNPRSVATEPIKNLLVEDMTDNEHRETLEILKDLPKRKSSVVKKNAELVAQDPASGMENGLSSKIPRLELPKNPQELNSDTPGTLENLQVKGEHVDNRVLKLFEKLREKKSSVEKNEAKLEILNPISSRTRGNSSKRPHLKARNTPESFTSSPLKEKMETKGTLRRMKKEVVKINRPNKSTHLLNEEEAERLKTSGNKRSEYPYAKRTNELPNKKPGSEVHHFANCGRNGFAKFDRIGDDETESNQTDESYQDFISVLEINDENMIYVPQDGRPETYDVEIKDEDAESSSDSDLVVLERDPVDRCRTPFKKDSNNDLESHTNFREGLMKDLKRPYDENEYIRLLMEWTNQRPAGGHAKNFRSGVVKTYALKGEYGKPYMDLYQDLAEIIKLSDRPRRLCLLRGFFYWLKNVSQDKSFEPWTDIECLNVVPQL
ncbi:uncharacterized protein LOC126784650 [Argentina anserina]|uniref:uncharacterized protein LOC126784650 n=1 Tax=Argentina anserina TaxID=57926 RepID=UPI0021767409|nr:uncharacterized protein LOC126784650 [Potentilla anserina]